MGRINLTPLRVRKRALANLESKRTSTRPCWIEVTADVPPSSQTLVRPLPIPQPRTEVRTRSLPHPIQSGRLLTAQTVTQHHPKSSPYYQSTGTQKLKARKPSRLFSPLPISYEEDALRTRFYSDHPWELARPRMVLETSGTQSRRSSSSQHQHQEPDWSTGLIQPGIPLSGECVIQRQLHLLHTTPNITVNESYDLARKEFYTLRRQQEIQQRVAAEEARAMGAQFAESRVEKDMRLENIAHADWERWSRTEVVDQMQRAAAFAGGTMQVESEMLEDASTVDTGGESGTSGSSGQGQRGAVGTALGGVGSRVFAGESQRSAGLASR